jgi:flavin-dependent dehydrogenase
VIDDIVIVGAGPAGAVAATVLARAGARVRLVDRAIFPRDKLCGDTINPGTFALLERLGIAETLVAKSLAIGGMVVSGEGRAIEAPYPDGLRGRALLRRELDAALLARAIDAGAEFEPAMTVRAPAIDNSAPRPSVAGVVVGSNGSARTIRSRIVIAADGRRSAIAFALGLARHPRWPRRWAIGTYFEDVGDMSTFGEMHLRRGRYIGVAPLPGGLTNVCLVRTWQRGDEPHGQAEAMLRRELSGDPMLRDRFSRARLVTAPTVLGPLGVDVAAPAIDGLLLAGDAAGFVDPMTGDGLRFAVRGGELAAAGALTALERGWNGVHGWIDDARRREFGAKWRFNRALRALVGSQTALRVAEALAPAAPSVVRAIVRNAGDCALVCR